MKRLFLAIKLPENVAMTLLKRQGEVRKQLKRSRVLWVSKENLHITLHFLGDVSEEVIPQLIEDLENQSYSGKLNFSIGQIDAFPDKKRPKTIFAETSREPKAIDLYKKIADVIVTKNLRLSRRAWTPHVTIGLVKIQSEVLKPEKLSFERLAFSVSSFELIESTLTDNGSIYKTIHSFSLV